MKTDVLPIIQVTAYLDENDKAELVPFGRKYQDGYRYALDTEIIEASYIPQAGGDGIKLWKFQICGKRIHLLKSGPHAEGGMPFWHEFPPDDVPEQLTGFTAAMAGNAALQWATMRKPDQ